MHLFPEIISCVPHESTHAPDPLHVSSPAHVVVQEPLFSTSQLLALHVGSGASVVHLLFCIVCPTGHTQLPAPLHESPATPFHRQPSRHSLELVGFTSWQRFALGVHFGGGEEMMVWCKCHLIVCPTGHTQQPAH